MVWALRKTLLSQSPFTENRRIEGAQMGTCTSPSFFSTELGAMPIWTRLLHLTGSIHRRPSLIILSVPFDVFGV
jgi:hypothetical protein